MQRLHARYPFLESARDAVEAADVDLVAVVTDDDPVVERALERVSATLEDGSIGEPARQPRTEVLSYPVARVLVSLVDEHVLTRKYARAEADAAHERFTAELEGGSTLKSTSEERLTLDSLLVEFDLTDDVRTGEGTTLTGGRGGQADVLVAVGAYLPLASGLWGDEWRLVNRALADGEVAVTQSELLTLLREAVRLRVERGLPLSVPDAIAAELEAEVGELRAVLADLDLTREIDTVVPELFPPCMQYLLDQIQRGEHLPHHSRFAITAFLATIGMSTDEIVELYRVNSSFGEEMTRYQTDHIRGATSPTAYSPPSCATMQSYGDCVNMDDLCERIPHPMAYYERRLDDSDEDDLEDWRERALEEGESESA